MKKIIIMAVSVMLVACGANNSNSTEEMPTPETPKASETATQTKVVDMTDEEQEIALRFDAIKAIKIGENLFKVAQKITREELDSLVREELGEVANLRNPIVWGVVDSFRWIVPPVYQEIVRPIDGRSDAFVVSYTEYVYDWSDEHRHYDSDGYWAPTWRYQTLYGVWYNNEIIAGWDDWENFIIVEDTKIRGVLNVYAEDGDEVALIWYPYPVRGAGYDICNHYLYQTVGSQPVYTAYKVEKGRLYMWDKELGETFEAAKANKGISQDEKSLMIWDFHRNKCVYNPFVSVD